MPSGLTNPLSTSVYDGRLLIADFDFTELWELDPDGADDQGGVLRDLPFGLTTPRSMAFMATYPSATTFGAEYGVVTASGIEGTGSSSDPPRVGEYGDILVVDLNSGLTYRYNNSAWDFGLAGPHIGFHDR